MAGIVMHAHTYFVPSLGELENLLSPNPPAGFLGLAKLMVVGTLVPLDILA